MALEWNGKREVYHPVTHEAKADPFGGASIAAQ